MRSFFSSVVSLLLSPVTWIILLLAAAWILRRKRIKRWLLVMAALVFIVFGNKALLNSGKRKFQSPPVAVASLPVYSCGIIPGGFASSFSGEQGYFNAAADRFIQAVKLYRNGKIKHILVSGGNGKTGENHFREAAWVKTQLIDFGIPDSVIITEDLSNNTQENALYSKRLIDSLQLPPPYLLITSALHIPRAQQLFRNAGLQADAFPCNYTTGNEGASLPDFVPGVSTLFDWSSFLKEAAGYWYYKK